MYIVIKHSLLSLDISNLICITPNSSYMIAMHMPRVKVYWRYWDLCLATYYWVCLELDMYWIVCLLPKKKKILYMSIALINITHAVLVGLVQFWGHFNFLLVCIRVEVSLDWAILSYFWSIFKMYMV